MYKPNLNDPRIIKTASRAWRLVSMNLHSSKPRQWATRHIDTWVGTSPKLGAWLRSQLLICVDPYYNPETGKCKKYLLNQDNWIALGHRLDLIAKVPCATQLFEAKVNSAATIFGAEIAAGNFQYTTKSNRMWNPIQHLDNEIRKPLFANYGYVHEYDIRSAAPTLLTQYARKSGFDKSIPIIELYLSDPNSFRQDLADRIDVDIKTAKTLITQRFAGASFGPQNSIAKTLDGRWVSYNRLRTDPVFVALSKEIVLLWQWIKVKENITVRLNSGMKWGIYFQEEYLVMKSVHRYLSDNNIQYFHEHDGWRSPKPVDLNLLTQHLQIETGYVLDFSYLEYIPLLEVFDVL